jgi:hypothetical protein
MNNQKDNQKTNINSYGHALPYGDKVLLHKSLFENINKKTEKLVTALYMVTDCMDLGDAIKGRLRLLGVDLLSDVYKLLELVPINKHTHISMCLSHINEILSLINISATLGYVSEMNTTILKKEFTKLASELKSLQSDDKHFTFTLDQKMFSIDHDENNGNLASQIIKDKRSLSMSFINSPRNNYLPKEQSDPGRNLINKEDRGLKILQLIKDKQVGGDGVSIKDISSAFMDVSEKTIQRELNSLVSKGQLKKLGAKRWSKYLSLT